MTQEPRRGAREAAFFETLAGIRVRRLQGVFGSHWQKWFRRRGLSITPVQGGLLMAIRENAGISQITLARLMRIEPPTLFQSLTPLIRDRLVVRRRSPEDGRMFELSLSPAGLRAAQTVEDLTPLHEADILRGLDAKERAQFLRLLDKAISGGEQAVAEASDELASEAASIEAGATG